MTTNPENGKGKISTSETGHAKNIANFEQLIIFCQSFGALYNPTKSSLTLTELQNLHQKANDHFNQTKTQKTNFNQETNARRNTFADLKPLSTKINNAFAVCGADPLAIKNIQAINKKMQGAASKATAAENPSEETVKSISTSQQSYDRQTDHLANLIEVLQANPDYQPNEPELQLTTLQTKLETLKTANTKVVKAYTNYSNARILRNQTLYDRLIGLVQIAKEVKKYVKSVYGATSPQYKQIAGLEIKKIKV